MTLRNLVLAITLLLSLAASIAHADIGVCITDTATGARFHGFTVDSISVNGGTSILIENPSKYNTTGDRAIVFTGEYRTVCEMLDVSSLVGHRWMWRFDNDERCERRGLAGAIRLLVQGNPGQVRLLAW